MSTATDITLNCKVCSGDIAIPDVVTRTWQAWACPNCGSWNPWMKHTSEPNEVITAPIYVSKWNIADMKGNLIPDEVVEGKWDQFVEYGPMRGDDPEHEKAKDELMQEFPKQDDELAENYKALKEAFINADEQDDGLMPDQDGDLHSPAWFIEAFITARENYLKLYDKIPQGDDEALDRHVALMDEALAELEMYEGFVNKLFRK